MSSIMTSVFEWRPHCQVIKSRRMRWAGEERGAYKVVVVKPRRGRLVGRPRHGWEENNKLTFQEVGGGVDWIDLAEDRDRWLALMNAFPGFQKVRRVSL